MKRLLVGTVAITAAAFAVSGWVTFEVGRAFRNLFNGV